MTLVFGANTEDDLVLRAELDGFKARFPERVDVVYTVSSLGEGGDSKLRRRQITQALLRQVMQTDGDQEKDVKVLCVDRTLWRGRCWVEMRFSGSLGIRRSRQIKNSSLRD